MDRVIVQVQCIPGREEEELSINEMEERETSGRKATGELLQSIPHTSKISVVLVACLLSVPKLMDSSGSFNADLTCLI